MVARVAVVVVMMIAAMVSYTITAPIIEAPKRRFAEFAEPSFW
jgi:hypothetical protein